MSIGRFIAAGYMTGDVACWDAGYDQAEHVLGPIEGSRLVASIACVILALRAERAERIFAWRTRWRRLVFDYEQRIDVSKAMIHVALGSLLLRRITH